MLEAEASAKEIVKPSRGKAPQRGIDLLLLIDSLDVGGAQRRLEVQADSLKGQVNSIRVVNPGASTPISERLRARGLEVVDLQARQLLDAGAFARLRGLVRLWRPDVIHAHLMHSIILGGLVSSREARFVATLHNEMNPGEDLPTRLKRGLEGFMLSRRAKVVVACGPRVALTQRSRVGQTPLLTIPNRISQPARLSPEERESLRHELGYGPADMVVLAAGRVSPQKGFDLLVEAFGSITESLAKLLILGAGDLQKLQSHIGATARGGSVQLLPSREDIHRVLAAADIFVLPSRWEGLPLVLLEAMAVGLPVIASNVGDVASATGRTGALLVPPEDVPALFEAISTLVQMPDRRVALATAAQEAVKPFLDLDAFARELLAAYR